MRRMYYRLPVQAPIATVDLIELINMAGVVGKIAGCNPAQIDGPIANQAQAEDRNEEVTKDESINKVPKEVRFEVEDHKAKVRVRKGYKDKEEEEVVIKFDTDHPEQEDMSVLSQSKGKIG